ncbi:response regulator transcription factor [Rhodoferax mekongensis]|uniref:response regulator transcription factor n=1 Tax=Rhodoferax mekongensis TaxID=3068341 RepID=UPI0028BD756A|nr:response regulator [Rhodoferax sp. TBRC 17199]MDT7517037.1 response regulator [Rhodoferax sp. TBRC 17199]
MTEKTIYLIDDDEAVLTSMERLLRLEGFSVKPFGSAEAFLKTYEGTFTGCVISDVRMPPGMSGLDLLLTLRKLKSQLPVIFLTGYSDVPAAVRAIKTGAVNFLLKPARIPELLSAIRESFSLNACQTPEGAVKDDVKRDSLELSRRESEVINLVVAGESNKMIATLLGISSRTVEIHRANGMKKLGTNTLHGLMTAVSSHSSVK